MHKVDYIRRQPWIGDYNALVDAVNQLIDKIQEKKETVEINIEREVKDYSFFKWVEVDMPFEETFLLLKPEDVYEVFDRFVFTYKETNQINDAIIGWKIVSLNIKVSELVTEKEIKQEATFETVTTVSAEELSKPKKKGRPKKNSWK